MMSLSGQVSYFWTIFLYIVGWAELFRTKLIDSLSLSAVFVFLSYFTIFSYRWLNIFEEI